MGEKRDMGDDRYGCNKQYVMILLKYQADKKIEGVYKAWRKEDVYLFGSIGSKLKTF